MILCSLKNTGESFLARYADVQAKFYAAMTSWRRKTMELQTLPKTGRQKVRLLTFAMPS